MRNSLVAILLGLVAGGAVSVAASCVWCVLHLPAHLQTRLRALSPHACAVAISAGLLLSAMRMGVQLRLFLPSWVAAIGFAAAGAFVGMLASALSEIMEVVPVLAHRLHVDNISRPARVMLTLGKALGAVLACLAILPD